MTESEKEKCTEDNVKEEKTKNVKRGDGKGREVMERKRQRTDGV